jgi:hypothetical protein
MVIWLPPNIDTIIPPTTAVIIPAIGGASLAIAKPKPKGNAIRLTTKPEKMLFGNALIKDCMLFILEFIEQ